MSMVQEIVSGAMGHRNLIGEIKSLGLDKSKNNKVGNSDLSRFEMKLTTKYKL
jgi:hypothetical protein